MGSNVLQGKNTLLSDVKLLRCVHLMICFRKIILTTEIYHKMEITAKMVWLLLQLNLSEFNGWTFPTHKVIHKWIKLENSQRKHKGNAAALNVDKVCVDGQLEHVIHCFCECVWMKQTGEMIGLHSNLPYWTVTAGRAQEQIQWDCCQ